MLRVTTSIRGACVVALSLLLSPAIFADKPQLFQIRIINQAGSPVKVYWPDDGSEGGVTNHQRLLDFYHQHDPSKATAEQANKLLAKYSAEQINFRLNRKYQAHAGLDLGELEGVLEARGQAVALFVAAGDVLQAVVPKNGRAFTFTAVQRATYEIKANRMVTTQREEL